MNTIPVKKLFKHDRLWLKVANTSLGLSVVVLAVTILVCYPLAHYFSLPIQLFGHIIMILDITLLKIAYVMRLVMQHSLGQPLI